MSIQSEITRITNAVADAYGAVDDKGGTLPVSQKVSNLASAIQSIPSGPPYIDPHVDVICGMEQPLGSVLGPTYTGSNFFTRRNGSVGIVLEFCYDNPSEDNVEFYGYRSVQISDETLSQYSTLEDYYNSIAPDFTGYTVVCDGETGKYLTQQHTIGYAANSSALHNNAIAIGVIKKNGAITQHVIKNFGKPIEDSAVFPPYYPIACSTSSSSYDCIYVNTSRGRSNSTSVTVLGSAWTSTASGTYFININYLNRDVAYGTWTTDFCINDVSVGSVTWNGYRGYIDGKIEVTLNIGDTLCLKGRSNSSSNYIGYSGWTVLRAV